MSWVAARTPVLRARASPNPWSSWRTTVTFSGVVRGTSSGTGDPSSTMTTSTSSRGQSWVSRAASVRASASGAS